MTDLLALVDAGKFGTLFLEELGWSSPNQPQTSVTTAEGKQFHLDQVAMYKGMGVWQCAGLPTPKEQRQIDAQIAHKNTERLIIYTDGTRQEWRWPRYNRNRTTGQPSLVPHRHVAGQPNPNLIDRLNHISIGMREDISVLELLHRMREAFDQEAETASRQAARLMGSLYERLDTAGMNDDDASAFLARALFLMFGDDTDMWPNNVFFNFLADDTQPDGSDLHAKLQEVFIAANSEVKKRPADLTPSLQRLPYINGGIFADPLPLPKTLGAEFRAALLDACKFDWGQISPAVFGSMFQTVKSREARRHLGEHYTTERNILRTIEPLFLDELNDELEASWDDPKALVALQDRLGSMRFLDPACGCGNFLIVAYREMRALELEILKRLRDIATDRSYQDRVLGQSSKGKRLLPGDAQLSIDATIDLKVSISSFYGIEIEAWPAHIAQTAMFLVDHQANKRMEGELGQAPTRLPIEVAAHIHIANSLQVDWTKVLDPDSQVVVMGNPPFSGALRLTSDQQTDRKRLFESIPEAVGINSGRLDLVLCWFAKSLAYLRGTSGRAGFVATNSIAQGEQARGLGQLISRFGGEIRYAYQSFAWESEAAGQAAVHVVITGFSCASTASPKQIFQVGTVESNDSVMTVEAINEYLLPGTWLLLAKRSKPFLNGLPSLTVGSQATDYGFLTLDDAHDVHEFEQDGISAPYVRKFVGAEEMIQGTHRWCLWLEGADLNTLRKSSILRERLERIEARRLESPTPQFRKAAQTPHLFTHNKQPRREYLAIPQVSSELRDYIPMKFFSPEVIASNALMVLEGADTWLFGILQSAHWNAWVGLVSGRLESRIRIAPDLAYNVFPFPHPNAERPSIEAAAEHLRRVQSDHSNMSLGQLYARATMPASLRQAHAALDSAVDQAYMIDTASSRSQRLQRLVEVYQGYLQDGTLNL